MHLKKSHVWLGGRRGGWAKSHDISPGGGGEGVENSSKSPHIINERPQIWAW